MNFLELELEKEYGQELAQQIISNLKNRPKLTLRVNTLKTNKEEIIKVFNEQNINYETVSFYDNAFIINADKTKIEDLTIYKEGKIYLQSLSSMIPPLYLDLKDNYSVLDMCAAPGGKTTLISALSNNKVSLTACENNKIRFERLKYNISKQGSNAFPLLKNSSTLDSFFKFDSILLDAPCSGSGTYSTNDSFSKDLVFNSSKLQLKLLKKALEILKPNQTLIYSTCSILKIENEDVINKVLNKNIVIEPIELDNNIKTLPSTIEGVHTIMPNDLYEGFFIAKIKKLK